MTFLRPLDVTVFVFSFSLAAEPPPLKRSRVEVEGMQDQIVSASREGTSQITLRDIDASNWNMFKAFRAELKGADSATQTVRCAEVLNQSNPIMYKLLSKPVKALLKYCCKRLSLATVLNSGYITNYKEQWAEVLRKLRSKWQGKRRFKRTYRRRFGYRSYRSSSWWKPTPSVGYGTNYYGYRKAKRAGMYYRRSFRPARYASSRYYYRPLRI